MKLVNQKGQTFEQFIKAYDASKYQKPSVTTDAVIFSIDDDAHEGGRGKVLQVLLIKRKDHPCIGQWALPGGFLNMSEPLYKGAQRELGEETNIHVFMEQLKTFGDDPNRDPRDRIVSVAYMALIDKASQQISADDDAEDAKWFSIYREERVEAEICEDSWGLHKSHRITHYRFVSEDRETVIEFDLDVNVEFSGYNHTQTEVAVKNNTGSDLLGFDHPEIIDCALTRLMGKVDYEPVALSLLPRTFTLPELMEVYEVIKNERFAKKNFHRNILNRGFLKETGEVRASGGKGKPAKVYTFDFNWAIWNRR
ncbi:MAG: NUDIX hydrolase [Clostridia bacterium]|nr:NUDIX hydrolase [Clostridia bacterium]